MVSHSSKLIEEKLTTLILNKLFSILAGGFVASGIAKGNKISATFAYQVTLWFLYQILFLLYAEARYLEATGNRCPNNSIILILTQISVPVNQKQIFSSSSTAIYDSLLRVFKEIKAEENSQGFLQYGGELFRFTEPVENLPPVNQFLIKNQLTDASLGLSLELLTRLDGEWINYQLIKVDYLGTLYQGLLEYHLEIVDETLGTVILKRNQHQRKLTASYYTPDYVVREIVTQTLEPILQQRGEQFQRLMIQSDNLIQQDVWEILLNFKVCDLAMGSGHFLVYAVEFIVNKLLEMLNQFPDPDLISERFLYQLVIKHCIYGVDIDAIAVELSKFSLWLQCLSKGVDLSNLEIHLYCGNALTDFPWGEQLQFDAIIGNPPYSILKRTEKFKDYLKTHQELKPSLGGKLDLFKVFIAQSIYLVREQGFIGLIVPMSLLADQQSSRLRKFILSEVKLIKIHAFPQKDDPNHRVFQDAKLPTCILYLQKIKPNHSSFSVIVHPGKEFQEIWGQFDCNDTQLKQLNAEQYPIPILKSNLDLDILKKLHQNPRIQRIKDIFPTYQGEINETKMAQFLSTEARDGEQVLRGGNIQRYEFIAQPKQGKIKYIKVQDYQQVIQGDRIHHCQKMRMGYQRNAALDSWKRLLFAPLPYPCYCFDSISYFMVQDQTQAFALLALLNSKLIEWRFQITSSNNHVSTAEIGALPIPKFNQFTVSTFYAPYFQQFQADYQRYQHQGDEQWLLNTVKTCIDGDRQDVIYQLLADLAKQMIDLHQQKQTELQRFLKHFLNHLGTNLKDLKFKTKLLNYLGNYQKNEPHLSFSELLKILKENRNKISIDLSSISVQNQLETEYRGSLEKLLPLKQQLRLTDHLIDAVIYPLYGLTEDEIKIIEERWQ